MILMLKSREQNIRHNFREVVHGYNKPQTVHCFVSC